MAKRKARAKKRTKKGKRRGGGLTQMSYTCSSDLAEIIGTKKATRPQVVKKLWAYIKSHRCQDSKNRRMINPDKRLSAVLGSRPIDMLKMAGCLSKHLKK